jgi:hypothetical protein
MAARRWPVASRPEEAGDQTLRLPADATEAERRAKDVQAFQVVLAIRAKHQDAELLIDVLGLRATARQVEFAQARVRAESLFGGRR